MTIPPSTGPSDVPQADEAGPEEIVRRKRIRHAWEAAPNSHDQLMMWLGILLALVLLAIISCIVMRKVAPESGKLPVQSSRMMQLDKALRVT